MKRYKHTAFIYDGIAIASVIEDDEGEYVRFEDVREKLDMFDRIMKIYDGGNFCDLCQNKTKCDTVNNRSRCPAYMRGEVYEIFTDARELQEAAK